MDVELDNINNFDIELAQLLRERPLEFFQVFENCVKEVYLKEINKSADEFPEEFQVLLFSNENSKQLRELNSKMLNQLVTVKGIIVNNSKINLKVKRLCIQCKYCENYKYLDIQSGPIQISLPRYCDASK